MTAARVYAFLVRLHPEVFRERFGAEMICIFEETPSNERAPLYTDCLFSLVRHWVLRSRYWIVAAAGLGAVVQLTLAGLAAQRGLAAVIGKATTASDALPPGGAILLFSGILTAAVMGIMLLGMTLRASQNGRGTGGRHKAPGRRLTASR